MGEFNSSYKNRVRYTLFHDVQGSLVIPEPIGWNSDDLIFKRNSTYHGIVNEYSNNLQFYGEAKTWLKTIYDFYGINAEVTLKKETKQLDTSDKAQPNSMLWKLNYIGTLDFNTIVQEENITKIKFNSSALIKKIKAKENENIEIERTIDLYNNAIDPIQVNEMTIYGRELLFITKYRQNTSILTYQTAQSSGAPNEAIAIPFEIYANSGLITTTPNGTRIPIAGASYTTGEIANMVYLISPNDQTIKLEIDLSVDFWSNSSNSLWFDIVIYNNGSALNYLGTVPLTTHAYSGGGETNVETLSHKETVNLNLLANQSVAISLKSQGSGDMHYTFHKDKSSLVITENSYADPTTSNFVFAHDLVSKVVEIVGGVNTPLESSYLGRTELGYIENGEGAHIGIASGRWIRGFNKNPLDLKDEYKPITISLKSTLKSMEASLAVGFGIVLRNNKEIPIIEKVKYFYQKEISIILPNKIKNVSRSVNSKINFTSLVFGYKKPNDAVSLYEEANGLDEPNTKNNYVTPLTSVTKKYVQESEIRADADGMEFARRKPRIDYPTTDTRYDNDNWWFNLKKVDNTWVQKLWADVFAQIPTGIYSPETATNLWFSPVNILLRHAWFFGAGLIKNASKYITYGSSKSNSNLRTKLIGGTEIGESDSILISDLPRPRLTGEKIKFDHYIDDNIMEQLKSFKEVKDSNNNSTFIPNLYFKIQFKNEFNKWETGYIDSIKPKGVGTWELLLANDKI